jgi:hypothetical protein
MTDVLPWGISEVVEPERTESSFAHVNRGTRGSGFGYVDLPVYPKANRDAGHRFRDARVARSIGLREAARRLGLTVVLLSDIERGRRTADIDAMIRKLREPT